MNPHGSTASAEDLRDDIEQLWETDQFDDTSAQAVISAAIDHIDAGNIRCAEPINGGWKVNVWVKKALDLYYRTKRPEIESNVGPFHFRDRFRLKGDLEQTEIRVAPPAVARYGSHFARGVTLMSSYVHLGVWVGEGTLIDSWVTLGTCAQIGAQVKILPNTSIVGSLYPLEATPTVIEDGAHVGSGCALGPGAIVRRGAIVASGVTVAPQTPVVDLCGESSHRLMGEVPENAIVIPGSVMPQNTRTGTALAAALIVGSRDDSLTVNENIAKAVSRHL